MKTYLRASIDAQVTPAEALRSLGRIVDHYRQNFPPLPDTTERANLTDDAGRTIGTLVIITENKDN